MFNLKNPLKNLAQTEAQPDLAVAETIEIQDVVEITFPSGKTAWGLITEIDAHDQLVKINIWNENLMDWIPGWFSTLALELIIKGDEIKTTLCNL